MAGISKDKKTAAVELDSIRIQSNQREAEKRHQEKINQFIEMVPARYRGKTFSDYHVEAEPQRKVKYIVERFTATFKDRLKEGTCLQFYGNTGTGKTLLSHIICQTLVQLGFNAKYEPSVEFLKNLLDIKFKSQSSFQTHLESYKRFHFLVLDEVTESITRDGMLSEVERQLLFKIINDRYENHLSTLIISNRNQEEIETRLGKPIMDRLSEKSISIAFNWDSYRTGQRK